MPAKLSEEETDDEKNVEPDVNLIQVSPTKSDKDVSDKEESDTAVKTPAKKAGNVKGNKTSKSVDKKVEEVTNEVSKKPATKGRPPGVKSAQSVTEEPQDDKSETAEPEVNLVPVKKGRRTEKDPVQEVM